MADVMATSELLPEINNTYWINATNTTAGSVGPHFGEDFFGTYYSKERFIAECIISLLSFTCNVVALVLTKGYYYQHHAYHTFFKNMATANALSVLGQCITNNSMYMFSGQMASISSMCHTLVLLLSLNVFATIFSLASGMTIMGFGIIHYLAICWPDHYDKYLKQKYVILAVAIIWILAFVFSLWPLAALLVTGSDAGCNIDRVEWFTVIGGNFSMGIVCACYIGLSLLCLRIYWEIRALQRRLSVSPWAEELHYERRTWRTIALLLITMTIFILPYYVMYTISLNALHPNASQAHPALMLYMNLLPYFKYAADPLTYGRRMLGLGERLRMRLRECCSWALKAKESSRSTHTTRNDVIRRARFERVRTKV